MTFGLFNITNQLHGEFIKSFPTQQAAVDYAREHGAASNVYDARRSDEDNGLRFRLGNSQ